MMNKISRIKGVMILLFALFWAATLSAQTVNIHGGTLEVTGNAGAFSSGNITINAPFYYYSTNTTTTPPATSTLYYLGSSALPYTWNGNQKYVKIESVTLTKTVSVGAQNGTLMEETAGTATFSVTTAYMAEGATGTVSWFTAADGLTAGSAPLGITPTVSNLLSNAATVTMTAANTTVAGTFYFKVTFDGVTSGVATLTIISGPPVPVFLDLANQYTISHPAVTLRVAGQGASQLTQFKVNGVPATQFNPASAGPGTHLIEATSTNGTLKIWKYIKVQ